MMLLVLLAAASLTGKGKYLEHEWRGCTQRLTFGDLKRSDGG
jgi:hypothetical protein